MSSLLWNLIQDASFRNEQNTMEYDWSLLTGQRKINVFVYIAHPPPPPRHFLFPQKLTNIPKFSFFGNPCKLIVHFLFIYVCRSHFFSQVRYDWEISWDSPLNFFNCRILGVPWAELDWQQPESTAGNSAICNSSGFFAARAWPSPTQLPRLGANTGSDS